MLSINPPRLHRRLEYPEFSLYIRFQPIEVSNCRPSRLLCGQCRRLEVACAIEGDKVLKYAGGAYLLYLAWYIARAGASSSAAPRAKPIGLFQAALIQWINPKGWVIAVGALTAYTTAAGDVRWETTVIAAVNAVTCLASVMIWAGFGAAIGRFLGNPRARQAFNRSMAGLLVISLIPVLG
jgi:threonine/homoserine/homoserine lactone efflux protein